MKIYFAASISLSRDYLPQYQQIVGLTKKLGHQVLSEHVVDSKLKPKDISQPEKIFQAETKKIEAADLIIAEVTAPSWGTAFLMEHALKHQKPVLALFYKDNGDHLPPMIKGHPELYVESYDEDNLKTVLKFNLDHFKQRIKRKGKLIVIDGANGSGKATQTDLLVKYLKKHKYKTSKISFPRYYTSFHGKTVARFLNGEFGGLKDVSPYLSSLAYALDRLTSKNQILDWLKAGHLVICDRYVTSSLVHQGVKLSLKERKKFIDWLYTMEYKEHRLPKENLVIYLYMPAEISDKLIIKKTKKYKKGKQKDIEEDLDYQRKVSKLYQEFGKKYKHWEIINCLDKEGKLKSRQDIHKEIINILKKRKILL
ncbi:hypothetical protein COT75_02030 [Candidatus Beckwithbacteria bacterium CG10_big_fil_rev_8_21_14_0_10_34_10]|uniref:Thymidylate kinase n=1 Tax=Candidatus Beckwithbacteria bacterium CG10_big_fil_rev_8_21_14_0_10_34_10 TaxID=1974495 RepID=A0A2H0WBN0_9BACT|nr:MAG: hypothetical protein COT75_02030 [Candidatus Beckwithbacteria bacterium CG10_big_fil_rev_8_21_14_0_10_34_10]